MKIRRLVVIVLLFPVMVPLTFVLGGLDAIFGSSMAMMVNDVARDIVNKLGGRVILSMDNIRKRFEGRLNTCVKCKWVIQGIPNKPSPINDTLYFCSLDKEDGKISIRDMVNPNWVCRKWNERNHGGSL